MQRLGSGKRWWAAEAVLRGSGLVLLGVCALASLWLYRAVHQPPAHKAGAGELLAGLIAVQGWCLGSSLLVQGPRLFKLLPDPRRRGIPISIRGPSR